MCGRYYMERGFEEKVVRRLRIKQTESSFGRPGDICPAEEAMVISKGPKLEKMRWGFPNPSGKGLIINSRSESAARRPLFADSLLHHRLVIPASGFYEWNNNREKAVFYREGDIPTYMLGLFNFFSEEPRFVILTTAANESMIPVHDRMPCIIEEDDINDWLQDEKHTDRYLRAVPPKLIREMEFEQLTLW